MDKQNIAELNILKEIDSNGQCTQRELGQRSGLTLSYLNVYLKGLVRKGYVSVRDMPGWRLRYNLTPAGIAKKEKVTLWNERGDDLQYLNNLATKNLIWLLKVVPKIIFLFFHYLMPSQGETRQNPNTFSLSLASATVRIRECSQGIKPTYRDFRPGDIMHSHANIVKARKILYYQPTHTIEDGLDLALEWYKKNMAIKVVG